MNPILIITNLSLFKKKKKKEMSIYQFKYFL